MVPRGLDGEWQLLRTGLRQGAGRHPQEGLVSGGLARERQLLHSLSAAARHHGITGTFQVIAKPAEAEPVPLVA